ncbi:Outward-rectifier potassium channel TOK1 [Candida viswanathii]|uniref:Outward-rectifier potassium channel TOK1 n=1 Tax=Candida viswanathii TaxID=5486 RepID=A0A367Y0G7_9ASCO|nr:Outward-rectifier potassium channel TOK1 [Candida viswanathii]
MKDAVKKAKDMIVPDPKLQNDLHDKGLQHYEDKLTPLLNNSYHGVNYKATTDSTSTDDKRLLKSPVALQHALSIPVETILNLNVRPGEPYFVLWFLISSYFPLIAACLGPLANMISIVGLIEHWKVSKATGHMVPDRPEVVVLNAMSLALGIIGNISLLMNFSRSVKYLISQTISILAWCFASAFLAAALLITHHNFIGVDPKYLPSEGFYFAAFTAAFYLTCTIILSVNFMGYRLHKYPPTFNLDQKQRTLMFYTIWFATWSIIGALVMGNLIDSLTYGSALYYCIVSFLTVGLGDILPQTAGAKVAVLVFSLIGVLVMGLIVATLRAVILSSAAPVIFWHNVEIARVKLIKELEAKDIHLSGDEAFHKMRVLRHKVRSRHNRISLGITVAVFLIFWLVGAAIFQQVEGWSYFNSMYFCFLCLITIGYGDYAPKKSLGRVFFVSWAVGAVPLMTILVSNVGDTLYVMCNDITAWFSTWMFSTQREYDEIKQFKKKLKEDQDDQITVSSAAVRREEMEEDQEIESLDELQRTLDEEDREMREDDEPLTSPSSKFSDVVSNTSKKPVVQAKQLEALRKRVALKKKTHLTLLEYLERLKPLINDSIEEPKRKYSHRQWSELLQSLGADEKYAADGYDGFWLGDNSPLRLPLVEPNYLVLKIYFHIEMVLRDMVELEIRDQELLDSLEAASENTSVSDLGMTTGRTIRFHGDE